VAAGEDGREDLLDHFILTDDHLLEFFLHQTAMLGELLQHVAKAAWFGGQGNLLSGCVVCKGEAVSLSRLFLVCRPDGPNGRSGRNAPHWAASGISGKPTG